jgi:hypothetical protein
MKSKKRLVIIIICVILLLVVALLLVKFFTKEETKNITNKIDMGNLENIEIKNNEKVNISKKMKEKVEKENLIFEINSLIANENETKIDIKVTNKSDEIFVGKEVTINFLDKSGRSYGKVEGYVSDIESNASINVKITTTLDVSNAYSFRIVD